MYLLIRVKPHMAAIRQKSLRHHAEEALIKTRLTAEPSPLLSDAGWWVIDDQTIKQH